MISRQIYDKVMEIVDFLEPGKYQHLNALFYLAEKEKGFIAERSENYDWINSGTQEDNAHFNNLHQEFQKIPIRGLFSDLENMERSLKYFAPDTTLIPVLFPSKIRTYIDLLTKAIVFYMSRNQNNQSFLIYHLMYHAYKLRNEIHDAKELYSAFAGALSKVESVTPYQAEENLSIYLESRVTFSQFIIKIDAIRSIYEELAQIMQVSTADNPIRLNKVESGSTWLDILAYPKIVSLIVKLIEDTISYFYRNFTTEGKIVALPRSVDAIESVLHLRKELKAVGVNTDDLDESINKSAVVIAQDLNHLLIGESRIKVNEQEHFIGEGFEEKYLEESRALLLPEATNLDNE